MVRLLYLEMFTKVNTLSTITGEERGWTNPRGKGGRDVATMNIGWFFSPLPVSERRPANAIKRLMFNGVPRNQ